MTAMPRFGKRNMMINGNMYYFKLVISPDFWFENFKQRIAIIASAKVNIGFPIFRCLHACWRDICEACL